MSVTNVKLQKSLLEKILNSEEILPKHNNATHLREKVFISVVEWFQSWKDWQKRLVITTIIKSLSERKLKFLKSTFEAVFRRDFPSKLYPNFDNFQLFESHHISNISNLKACLKESDGSFDKMSELSKKKPTGFKRAEWLLNHYNEIIKHFCSLGKLDILEYKRESTASSERPSKLNSESAKDKIYLSKNKKSSLNQSWKPEFYGEFPKNFPKLPSLVNKDQRKTVEKNGLKSPVLSLSDVDTNDFLSSSSQNDLGILVTKSQKVGEEYFRSFHTNKNKTLAPNIKQIFKPKKLWFKSTKLKPPQRTGLKDLFRHQIKLIFEIIEQWDEEDKVKLVLEIVSKQNPDVLRFTASFIRFTELQVSQQEETFAYLPQTFWFNVFRRISLEDILNIEQVNTQFNLLSKIEKMWKILIYELGKGYNIKNLVDRVKAKVPKHNCVDWRKVFFILRDCLIDGGDSLNDVLKHIKRFSYKIVEAEPAESESVLPKSDKMITKKNDKEVDSEYKKMKYSWKNLVNHLGEINGVSHLVSEVKLKASNENINWEEQFLSLQNRFQNKSDHFESLNEDFQLPLLRKISDQLIEDSTQKIRNAKVSRTRFKIKKNKGKNRKMISWSRASKDVKQVEKFGEKMNNEKENIFLKAKKLNSKSSIKENMKKKFSSKSLHTLFEDFHLPPLVKRSSDIIMEDFRSKNSAIAKSKKPQKLKSDLKSLKKSTNESISKYLKNIKDAKVSKAKLPALQKNEKDKSLNQWLKVYKDIQKVERLDEKLNKEINRQKIRKMKNQFSKKPKSENQMLQNEKFEDLEQEEKKEEEELTSRKCLFEKPQTKSSCHFTSSNHLLKKLKAKVQNKQCCFEDKMLAKIKKECHKLNDDEKIILKFWEKKSTEDIHIPISIQEEDDLEDDLVDYSSTDSEKSASLENKCSELCIQGVKYNNLLSDAEIKSSFETFFVDHHMNEPEESFKKLIKVKKVLIIESKKKRPISSVVCRGDRLYAGGTGGKIRVWSPHGKDYTSMMQPLHGTILSMAIVSDEKSIRLFAGSWDTTIRVWNLKSGKIINCLKGHTSSVTGVCLDKKYIVTCSHDKSIRIWDIITYRLVRVLLVHTKPINCLDYSKGLIASGSNDRLIYVSSADSGLIIRKLEGHRTAVNCVKICKKTVVSGDCQGYIHVWSLVQEVALLHNFQAHQLTVTSLKIFKDHLFSASEDQYIKEWSISDQACLRILQGHTDAVTDIDICDQYLLSGSKDGTIRVWWWAQSGADN